MAGMLSRASPYMLLSRGRLFSSHVVLDEDGWLGSVRLYEHAFLLRVWHRWSGRVGVSWECSRRSPTWSELMPDWRSHVALFVKRLQDTEKGALLGGKASDPKFADDYPALAEHLCLDWLEGSARQPSTLTITTDGGRWRGSIRDRDNGLVAFLTADGFYDLLGALEHNLANDSLDWRADQFAQAKGQQRKKR